MSCSTGSRLNLAKQKQRCINLFLNYKNRPHISTPLKINKMKKSILAVAASVFITGAIITSCNTSSEKVENSQNNVKEAQNNVNEANKDLDKANQEYLNDIENYRKETADKIAANDKSIDDLKAKIKHEKKEAKADYKKKVDELEQKNNDMKKKLDDYKADGKEKWEIFKAEFNHDMDELGKALKDMTVKNVK